MTTESKWRNDDWWTGTRAPLREATGLHPEAYTSDGFFADEQSRVFERSWVCIGAADDVAAGRLIVRSLGTRSIIVTLNSEGELRGWLNSCRHRGTELAEADCDIRGTIRCPYHRWGYDLDGTLVAAPFFDDVPRTDSLRDGLGLVPVRVETWGCLLFACLDQRTPPLSDTLGDLPVRMGGYDLSTWRTHHSQTLDINANWKLISENYQEYYHLTWVHPELAKVSRVADHYRYQGAGMYCGQTTTPVSGDDRDDWLAMPAMTGLDDSDSVSGRFVALFPNVLLSVLPNHVFVLCLDPLAPGLTRETCTWLVPASTTSLTEDAFESTRTFWLDVNTEDIDIVERGQRGLTRGGVPAGPLAPRFEEPLHRFHSMLANAMTMENPADWPVPDGDDLSEDARLGTGENPTPALIDR